MSDFHALTISAVDKLTPNSVALTFGIPKELAATFSFTAGQYITVKHTVNGEKVRRAYSISSAPSSGKLTVGIKKVPGGTFSVYANESIKAGDVLEVMQPEGRFIFEKDGASKTIAAFAAGSGITPIMSIAETVLENNEQSKFVLVFGNQTPEEAMYREAIVALQNKYTNRFFAQWLYSRSSEPDCLFGRIETSTVNLITKNKFKDFNFDAFYLCGPEQMINTVSDTLKANGVQENKILFELFTSSETDDSLAESLDGKTAVEVVVDEETFSLTIDQKTLVLDAVLKEDIDAPYSCQGGVCSSCIARVTEGKAEMVKNQILTDAEVAEGLILTCQAHATTSTLKIDYDNV
ncbi:ferredoxin--NADP reductase [Croceitalea rosinachiae]|uniref:Ferredoxin--NADP reductase n=1 Tax=Croceitalea rosinachiae TaxID=3075596 RepID=A0ABU3A7R0_9FLAO|nr:ferredoxin--NADP reductase [Croceitalea sp. F388]MDT0606218.1 ferredoxin--NADP reductase [Croceitalea sp. F388]